MYVEKRGFDLCGIRWWAVGACVAVVCTVAVAQDAAAPPAPAPASKPADAATGVRPDAYVIGAEDVISSMSGKSRTCRRRSPFGLTA